eukprot:SAG11_NODE_17257_length_523_cov_3.806604_1_plen_57_part_00
MQATGKSDADTIYDSVEELDPPTGTTGDGTDPLTPGQNSVDDAERPMRIERGEQYF